MSCLQLSQSSPLGALCLPLLKFSYATVAAESVAPVQWTHVSTKNDLFALFETARARAMDGSVEERQMFKVLKDPEIMEELDLQVLSDEASRAMASVQDPLAHSHNPKIVAIIVKAPLIAIRYPLAGSQIRRFQIRFARNEGYYEAMKMLSRANVPTLEAGTFPAQRPLTAPNPAMSNSLSQKTPAHYVERPVTRSQAAEVRAAATAPVNIGAPAAADAGTPSEVIPSPAYLGPTLDSTVAPLKYFRPATTASLASTLHQPIAEVGRHQGKWPEQSSCASHEKLACPNSIPSISEQGSFQSHSVNKTQALQLDFYTPRPSTAPARTNQHLSQILPARRELPFEISRSRLSTTRKVECRAEGSISDSPTPACVPPMALTAHEDTVAAIESRPSPIISTKRKRASTKPANPPASKKSRKASSREKASAKNVKDDKPIPSVEELLKQPEETQNPDSEYNRHAIDTQKLLARVEQAHGFLLSGSTVVECSSPKTRISAVATPASMRQSLPAVASTTATKESAFTTHQDILCPLTDRMINTSTLGAHGIEPYQESCQPVATPDVAAKSPSVQIPNISSDSAIQPTAGDFAQALAVLMRDSAFEDSVSRLANWAQLPEDQQRAALRTYICQQLREPQFAALCRTIEPMWERMILYSGPRTRPFTNL